MSTECYLVCGYETLNLNDQTTNNWTYRHADGGFNPQTAQPSDDVLNTSGYDDVLETMIVQIQAANKTAIMAARHVLVNWLYRAKQFIRGETQYPTVLKFKLDGMNEYQYVMLIPESGDPELIGQPSNFVQSVNQVLIADVTIQVRRRPILLNDVSAPATSASVAQGKIATITLGNVDIRTPSDIQLNGFVVDQSIANGYILATSGENTLKMGQFFSFQLNKGIATANGTLINTNESGALDGQMYRWTPATTNPCHISLESSLADVKSCMIVLIVRNNTANKRYLIAPVGFIASSPYAILGKTSVIDIPAGEVAIMPLGYIATNEPMLGQGLWIKPIDTGGTLDFDALYVLQGDADPQVIDFRSVSLADMGSNGDTIKFSLNNQYLSDRDASALFQNLSGTQKVHCEGFAEQSLYLRGVKANIVFVARSRGIFTGTWSWSVATTRPSITVDVTMPKASLHPR